MAIRWRKYHPACKGKRSEGDRHGKVIEKGIDCEGRRGRHCPEGVTSPCGAWAIDYREFDGRWVSKVFPGINKTQAGELLEEIKSNIRRMIFGLPIRKKMPPLGEYALTYLELCRSEKETTFTMKRSCINALIRHIGDYSLDKLTPFIIEKYRLERREKDGVKDSSINIDIAILSHIFTTAIKAGIVEKNPCKGVRRLKITETKDRILSQAEIGLLMDKLQGKDRLMVMTALFTGLRLGGVLGLCWGDIDFTNGIISSNHKTSKLLSIPLSDYLKNALEAYRKDSTGERVFESRPITKTVASDYSEYFSALFKSLGLSGVTFHTLRHTFSSILQGELGIGAVVVQSMTGHSSLGMLQKYSHSGLDNGRIAIKALTAHVLNTSTKVNFAVAQ